MCAYMFVYFDALLSFCQTSVLVRNTCTYTCIHVASAAYSCTCMNACAAKQF